MIIKKRWLAALVTLLAVGSLAGCGSNDAGSGKVLGKHASSSQTSPAKSTSTTDNSKLKKAEAILKDAQALNADGKYKQSNKKLSSIDLADLNKKSFSALKTEFFTLQKSNDKFLLKKSKDSSNKSTTTTKSGSTATTTTAKSTPATNNSFDNYSKFVGDYSFYNYDEDRLQSDLTISSDGTVVQNNTDGSAFHGVATVKASGASGILSYDVTSDSSDTKSIKADVEIDVTWSGGDHETYYGYTSYDNYSVLTDGKSYDGDLVNEVWVQ